MQIKDYAQSLYSGMRYLITGRPSEKEFYQEVGNLLRVKDELKRLGISSRKDITSIIRAAPKEKRIVELNRKIRYAELERFKGEEAKEYILKQFEIERLERQKTQFSRHR